jgi:N-formylglutamate amidohydrolase
MQPFPEWVIFHVPHDSKVIPAEVRHQFALDDAALMQEIIKMTDHHTLELFTRDVPEQQIIRSPVSRLVVDVERFLDDTMESMATKGMGVVYNQTSSGEALRHPIENKDRQTLIDDWYDPHHHKLINLTQQLLDKYNQVLLIDAHSFPSVPLPYEPDQELNRPQICIGTDSFHTPNALKRSFARQFEAAGFSAAINAPFAGSLVPMPFYQIDSRVSSVMIEVNRALYCDEKTGEVTANFDQVSRQIQDCLISGMI